MKSLILTVLMSTFALVGFSQNISTISPMTAEDTAAILDSLKMELSFAFSPSDTIPVTIKGNYNDSKLRGNFTKVFTSEKYWKKFAIGHDGKYRFINAPETNWYFAELGLEKSDRYTFCTYKHIMIDSSVVNYYNTKLKGFTYDYYKYGISYNKTGAVYENYSFYKNGKEIRWFGLIWAENELCTISDDDIPGRE